MRSNFMIISLLFLNVCYAQTFTNPLLPSGADPYSFYKDGYYYYTHTTGSRLVLWKTKDITDLQHAEKKIFVISVDNSVYSAVSKMLRHPDHSGNR
ncbi:MAG: hypothetical protein QM640_08725 [Niabella sp.]